MRLPPRPDLTWKDDGTPVDRRVDDVYFSVEDGLQETRTVFLAGCGLPEAWQNTQTFTIAELGFGTGLNFLATWHAWRAERSESGWLNFVSFEGFPFDAEDIRQAMRPWPELTELADKLVAKWPPRAFGVRQLVWPEERLSLTLHIGPIEQTLAQSQFSAHAWFLDGFSPAKNAAMWADELWPLIAARSASGARAATFTVAGAVRRGLSGVGFEVEKRPGHGRKRERLEATYRGSASHVSKTALAPVRVAVVGAGIAGACLARVLTDRGAQVQVFDQSSGPAQGTSGNPLALVMPRLDAADTVQARLLIDAYLSAQAFYAERAGVDVAATTHRPRHNEEATRFAKMLADPPLGLDQLEALPRGAVLHKQSLVLHPPALIADLLLDISVAWGQSVDIDSDQRTVNGSPFDATILATGWHMQRSLPALDLTGRLGQVEWAQCEPDLPANALAAGHYAVASGPLRLWGATFADHAGGNPERSDSARFENMTALNELAPYWQRDAEKASAQSRAGVRATTADRLPLIGALPDTDAIRLDRSALERRGWRIDLDAYAKIGIYIAGGFGSRGFTWAPWAAAILSAQLFGDPVPATLNALRATVPNRQILRRLKREDS